MKPKSILLSLLLLVGVVTLTSSTTSRTIKLSGCTGWRTEIAPDQNHPGQCLQYTCRTCTDADGNEDEQCLDVVQVNCPPQ